MAKYGRCLGTHLTNNEAEYAGLLDAIAHAVARHRRSRPSSSSSQPVRLEFRVDSLLVCEQVNGRWRCLCPTLRPLYEQALDKLRHLRTALGMANLRVIHIYREYNADADGAANEALDLRRTIDDAWSTWEQRDFS